MDDQIDIRIEAINRVLFIGPVLILLAWFLAGQWDVAGPETRAWLQFAGVACLASLVPLPGVSRSLSALRARVQDRLRLSGSEDRRHRRALALRDRVRER